jgi:single-strand selective monofunctional uracil DNA glycosylase
MTLPGITNQLVSDIAKLRFADPVSCVYNPLVHARAPHDLYLRRFGTGAREVILVGMNPGPFGMAQTGVPFGDVRMVRDWMGIEAPVGRPDPEHPKRPVQGFACPRSEVSGTRLWGWARDRFGTPDRFFARFFVVNYCPLCFMEASGRNRTPDKLPASERDPLFAACDKALRAIATVMKPRMVLGVGGFAEQRVIAALADTGTATGRIPHPSPASPAANRGWDRLADEALAKLGIATG